MDDAEKRANLICHEALGSDGPSKLHPRLHPAIATAIREAVAAENAACVEIAWAQNLDGYEKGFTEGGALRLAHELANNVAEDIANTIKARVVPERE